MSIAAPRILGKQVNGTPIVGDEFIWGKLGRTILNWRVISIDDNTLTAITTSTIAERQFSAVGSAWEESDLRCWLNNEFISEAFGDYASMLSTWQETGDKASVLSIEETQTLLPQDASRAPEGENRNWWLRDNGGDHGFQAYVHNNGWINEYGAEVASTYAAVRPAIKLSLDVVEFATPNPNETDENPYLAQSFADFSNGRTPVLASEYGEELLLEALEADNVFLLKDFVSWFGVHEAWETMFVETLSTLAGDGDSIKINELLDMCNGIEYLGAALSEAMSQGHVAVSGTLLRAGATLDAGATKAHLVCDTPELRRIRKASYPKEQELCDKILASDSGDYSIRTLIRQNLISGRNYHALLRAASKSEDTRELFEWMLCPDYKPLKKTSVCVAKKRVQIVDHPQGNSAPVSEWALQMLWYPKLIQDNPQAARALSTFLTDSNMEGKRELICFLAKENCRDEIETILSGEKVFSPKDIAAAIDAATSASHSGLARYMKDFLRSIGAGKLLAKDE